MTLAVDELAAVEAALLAGDGLDSADVDDAGDVDPVELAAWLADLDADGASGGDEVTRWLDDTLARVGGLAAGSGGVSDAARI